jgi:hypothetical protein
MGFSVINFYSSASYRRGIELWTPYYRHAQSKTEPGQSTGIKATGE